MKATVRRLLTDEERASMDLYGRLSSPRIRPTGAARAALAALTVEPIHGVQASVVAGVTSAHGVSAFDAVEQLERLGYQVSRYRTRGEWHFRLEAVPAGVRPLSDRGATA